MAEYTLGDEKAILKFGPDGKAWLEISGRLPKDVQPEELRKLAQAIEDKKLKQLEDDTN